MNRLIDLRSSGVRLRSTVEADLNFVLATEHHEENAPYVTGWARAQHLAALDAADLAHLIVEASDDEIPAGYMIIAGLTSQGDNVELRRIAIARKGEGLGRGALQLIKQFVFEQLGAHRLWLDVVDHNERARLLYESEGFVVEGTLRDADEYDGRYHSLVIMSMLENEYPSA